MKKICVFGAGAVGGHLAARLARGGAQVSIVARGPYLDTIRERGLLVRAADGDHHSRPHAVADPAVLGPQDAVLVTVKQPSLPTVATTIGPLLTPETVVVFVMNGIPWWYCDRSRGALEAFSLPGLDPGGELRRVVGVERTLGGVVYSACTIVEPGVVRVGHDRNRLILGEPDGKLSGRAQTLAAIIAADRGMKAEITRDIRSEIWTKLVGGMTVGALCILSGRDIRTTLSEPAVLGTARKMMVEAAAIATAAGCRICTALEQRLQHSAGLEHKPSILQDLERGRPAEVEAQFTTPMMLARKLGVPTPHLDPVIALAMMAATGAADWSSGSAPFSGATRHGRRLGAAGQP